MSSDQSITQRDIDTVITLYKHRYLKTSQIQQLYFPSLHTANRRLRSLTEQGLVKQFTVPNIPERIYHVAKKGAHLVAQQLSVTVPELKWSEHTHAPKDYYFMQHFLGINQFRMDVTKACAKSEIELLGFIPEYYGSKKASGHTTKYIKDFIIDAANPANKISHTPDAVFALQKSGKPALFFLEIDRGTEVLTNPEKGFLKMLHFYINYAKSGKFKTYQEEFKCAGLKVFRLLIVTTSAERLENMREASGGGAGGDTKLLRYFWLTTFAKVSAESFWQPIWTALQRADQATYAIH